MRRHCVCIVAPTRKGVKAIQWDKLWYDFPVFIVSHYREQAVSFKKVDLPESLLQRPLSQGVVIPIGAVVTAVTGVKKRSRGQEAVKGSRAVFGVGQAVKDNFQTW